MKLGDSFKKFSQIFSNVKTRTLLVVLVVAFFVLSVLIWTFTRDDEGILDDPSRTKRVRPIESLPGTGDPNLVYDPLVEQANVEQAQEALQTGGAAVPTLLNVGPEGYGRGGFGEFDDGTGRCGEECYDDGGYDAQGYDRDGYDINGYDKNGYDRDGYDKDGYDRNGYDRDGYDKNGCDRQGKDRNGNPCEESLFGDDCFNSNGLDVNGCNRDGLDPEGNACYGSDGYNVDGYDYCGFDRNGFNKDGLDCNGCDKSGLNRRGAACYGADGFNDKGLDRFCRNREGFDRDGYDKDGYDINGCDENNLDRDGNRCYDNRGYTQAGYDRQGYNRQGVNRDGYDRQGFDANGYDKDGYDRFGCNAAGLDRNGRPCGATVAQEDDDLSSILTGGDIGTGGGVVDQQARAAAQYERLLAEQRALDQQRIAELSAVQQQEQLANQQAQLDAFESLMSNQAQGILQAWAPPKQNFVQGVPWPEQQTVPVAATTGANGLPLAGQGPLVYKAGDVAFAVVETSVNSDQPGPVMARIVNGPLKGAKLLGSFERQQKKLMLSFNVLSIPDLPQSIGINAIAIDPETARTALATGVDNHYLTKYGTLIASSFLEGMGLAVETSLGTPELTNENGAIVASQLQASSKDQLIVGLGKVGQRIAQEIDQSDIQPTVTIDSGTGIGLLMMSDLRIEQPEEKVVNNQVQQQPAMNGEGGQQANGQTNEQRSIVGSSLRDGERNRANQQTNSQGNGQTNGQAGSQNS